MAVPGMIELICGDITQQETEAIVNAANSSLLGGGGVDGAIHRGAGPELLEACRQIGGCPTGEARITRGYRLPAKYVIHTVGPIYRDGKHNEPELLARAYENSLKTGLDNRLKSISFPSISTGAYRFPICEAAEIALSTVLGFMADNPGIELVRFVLFSEPDLEVYRRTFEDLTGLDESGTN